MSVELSTLDIPAELYSFFSLDTGAVFNFGDQTETFSERGHYVPATRNIWMAGNHPAPVLIISYSVMESLAMLSLNIQRFTSLENLAVVALGCRIHLKQIDWIRENFKRSRVILVFGNDLAGRATDIKVASWLQQNDTTIAFRNHMMTILRNGSCHRFKADRLSLSAYKCASGIRNKIRTRKPRRFNTFLDELKHDAA